MENFSLFLFPPALQLFGTMGLWNSIWGTHAHKNHILQSKGSVEQIGSLRGHSSFCLIFFLPFVHCIIKKILPGEQEVWRLNWLRWKLDCNNSDFVSLWPYLDSVVSEYCITKITYRFVHVFLINRQGLLQQSPVQSLWVLSMDEVPGTVWHILESCLLAPLFAGCLQMYRQRERGPKPGERSLCTAQALAETVHPTSVSGHCNMPGVGRESHAICCWHLIVRGTHQSAKLVFDDIWHCSMPTPLHFYSFVVLKYWRTLSSFLAVQSWRGIPNLYGGRT